MTATMLQRILLAALLLYCTALAGAMVATAGSVGIKHSSAVIHTSRPVAPLPDPLVGYTIEFKQSNDLSAYLSAIDEIAALGFNSLQIMTPVYQDDGSSPSLRIVQGPGMSPSREDLVELLLYAKTRGLATTLTPVVEFIKPRSNDWRGNLTPEQWGPWWDSYEKNLDYFLSVAIESDVPMVCIGTDLLTTETSQAQWQKLISSVRSKYKGKLIYSTRWDRYQTPAFWNLVDFIGVSGYWDMTTLVPAASEADPDAMSRRWLEIRTKLLDFSHKQSRPVLLTQVGYPSVPWALKEPWKNATAGPETKADPLSQAAGYRAFLSAWETLLPGPARNHLTPPEAMVTPEHSSTQGQNLRRRREGFMGFYFYAWDVQSQGGLLDTGYGVRNKPSMEIIRKFMLKQGFLLQSQSSSEESPQVTTSIPSGLEDN